MDKTEGISFVEAELPGYVMPDIQYGGKGQEPNIVVGPVKERIKPGDLDGVP